MSDLFPEEDRVSSLEAGVEQAGPGDAQSPSLLLSRSMRTMAVRGGMLILSLAFAVVLARALSPSARGNFALLQALTGLTVVLVNFAVGKAVVYHVGKGRIPLRSAGSAAFVLGLLSGMIGAAVIIPLSLALRGSLMPGIAPGLIAIAVCLATPRIVREYLGGAMVAIGRPLDYVATVAAQPLSAFLVVLVLITLHKASLGGAFVGWATGIVLSSAVAAVVTMSYSHGWGMARRQDLRELGRFGLRTYPSLLARFLNLRLDQFLVRVLSSAAALGQYAVAVSLAEVLLRMPGLILLALSGAISSASREKSAALVVQFCRWMLIILLVTVVVFAVATPIAVPRLFGAKYRPAISSVLILLPGMVFFAPTAIIMDYFIVQRGQPLRALFIAGSSLVTGISLNFPLTPKLGAAGASIASTTSYGVMLLIAVFLFSRDSGLPARALFAFSRADVSGMVSSLRHALGIRDGRAHFPTDEPS